MIKNKVKNLMLKCAAACFNNRGSKICYYHDVFDAIEYTGMGTSLDLFNRHIEVMKKEGFTIVESITQLKCEVSICFDDGFRGIWDTRRFFVENRIYPTIFVSVELIGKNGYLNEKEIIELQSLGFNFQSHGFSHKNLTRFNEQQLKHELIDSRIVLSELLCKDVDEICFPHGYFSDRVHRMCMESGYKKMYTSIPGCYHNEFGEGLLCRNLLQSCTASEVKYILNGGLNILKPRYILMHYLKRKSL